MITQTFPPKVTIQITQEDIDNNMHQCNWCPIHDAFIRALDPSLRLNCRLTYWPSAEIVRLAITDCIGQTIAVYNYTRELIQWLDRYDDYRYNDSKPGVFTLYLAEIEDLS